MSVNGKSLAMKIRCSEEQEETKTAGLASTGIGFCPSATFRLSRCSTQDNIYFPVFRTKEKFDWLSGSKETSPKVCGRWQRSTSLKTRRTAWGRGGGEAWLVRLNKMELDAT